MKRALVRVVLGGILVSASPACSDSTGPDLGTLVYEVWSGCVPDIFNGVFTCSPQQTSVARGDSLLVGHLLIDTSATLSATARVVGSCAVNFEITRSGTLVATLPAQPTCPDSVAEQGDNPPRVYNARIRFWHVPADAPTGQYTITSVLVVEPRITRSLQVRVE